MTARPATARLSGLRPPNDVTARIAPAVRAFAFVASAMFAAVIPAGAQELTPFLVQSACVDARGAPVPGLLPVEPGCTRRRPLGFSDPLPYRKHDWPAAAQAARRPEGYHASDSLRATWLNRDVVVQTLDFGDNDRRFGVFDDGRGDGGHVVRMAPSDGGAYVVYTQGGRNSAWFRSPGCAAGVDGGMQGWLLAAPGRPGPDGWMQRVVQLRIGPTAESCPAAFDRSLTRWRFARIAVPWRDTAGAQGEAMVDAIVTEHYGGPGPIPRAGHLERIWLARDLGMIRWERWENRGFSRRQNIDEAAARLEAVRRCPPIAFDDPPPGGAWARTDCRTWTNFARATAGQPLHTMPWPAGAR